MRKFIIYFNFIKTIFKSDFILEVPKKKIVVFDNEIDFDNKLLFKQFINDCFFLDVRFYNLRNIYINTKVLFLTIYNILQGNFNFGSYLAAVISIISPKVLVTTIDFSHQFYNVCRILKKNKEKIRMIAIQRSTRDSIKYLEFKDNKNIFIPEYFCFGQYEINLHKKMRIKIEKFKTVGSFCFSNYKKKYKQCTKNKFDLCLVAEYPYNIHDNDKLKYSEKKHKYFLSILDKFVKKYKLRLVIIGKRAKSKIKLEHNSVPTIIRNKQLLEKKFYKKYIKSKHLYIERNYKTFSSYKYSMQSKVTIGTVSTILREVLAAKKKILACNPFADAGKFPIKGICYLEKFNFIKFEQRLKRILTISERKYFQEIKKDPNYLVKYDPNFLAGDVIVKEIKKSLD